MLRMTIAEKILTKKNIAQAPAQAGQLIDCHLDRVFAFDDYPYIRKAYKKIGFPDGPPRIWDMDRFCLMVEHWQPPENIAAAEESRAARHFARKAGVMHFYEECGICHQMVFDRGLVRPGELAISPDSHTMIYGALNAAGTAAASEEIAYAIAFGEMWFRVPETIKIVLTGHVPNYPIGKDIILTLAGIHSDAVALYRAIEFCGPAVGEITMDSRMCIAVHGAEVGAKFVFFPADRVARDYLATRTDDPYEAAEADEGAEYVKEIQLDVSNLGFPIARPHRFDNVVSVDDLRGVKIDQALLGSCANGRFEDLEIAARLLEGSKIHRHVRFFVEPASWVIYRECLEAGIVARLIEAGAQILQPGCWICEGNGSVLAEGEACITSGTRNYRGRKGSPNAEIYLAGPAAVTAAAVAGEITNPKEVFSAFRD